MNPLSQGRKVPILDNGGYFHFSRYKNSAGELVMLEETIRERTKIFSLGYTLFTGNSVSVRLVEF